MTKALARTAKYPTDPVTGLILPLSKSLGSRDLATHRAMVALELEVVAKKMDRFGWEKDRNSTSHDRLMTDWMDALMDFPLVEVQTACRLWVQENPRKMPNEGDIRAIVLRQRQRALAARRPVPPTSRPDRRVAPLTKERAAEIMQEAGFRPRVFGA